MDKIFLYKICDNFHSDQCMGSSRGLQLSKFLKSMIPKINAPLFNPSPVFILKFSLNHAPSLTMQLWFCLFSLSTTLSLSPFLYFQSYFSPFFILFILIYIIVFIHKILFCFQGNFIILIDLFKIPFSYWYMQII